MALDSASAIYRALHVHTPSYDPTKGTSLLTKKPLPSPSTTPVTETFEQEGDPICVQFHLVTYDPQGCPVCFA
jgi:hypothetical protein